VLQKPRCTKRNVIYPAFLHEPLYLNNLVQGNNPPVAFVVGNRDGLCEIERIPS
jgi:hypothetical protein